ncbi:hypothetical protein [Chryseobacterium sp. JK1]|uniref:hypothetical protein n=1 Tax=Chryseobacterium sp. JK1 TaxID=874294 RepID=UPI003D685D34
MKLIHRYLFISGICILLLSVIMFLVGIGMFTASGNFPQFIVKLAELCFAFWLPFLILGSIFTTTGAVMGLIFERKKS